MSVAPRDSIGAWHRSISAGFGRLLGVLLTVVMLAAVSVACFAIGRLGHDAEQPGPPPWSRAQAQPSATIEAVESPALAIADLPVTRRVAGGHSRTHAVTRSAAVAARNPTTSASEGASSSASQVQPATSTAPSTQALPDVRGSSGSPSTTSTRSSGSGSGEGSTSGSFDSSG